MAESVVVDVEVVFEVGVRLRLCGAFQTVAAVMFAVGLLAAAGPARRGLAIDPTEALGIEWEVRTTGARLTVEEQRRW